MTRDVWLFSDAAYAGGAESYLRWHLDAAGPSRMGLAYVDHPGLLPWIDEIRTAGFTTHAIEGTSLLSRWRALLSFLRAERPRVLHVNLPGPYDGLLTLAVLAARMAGTERVVTTEHLPSVGRVGRRYWAKRLLLRYVDETIVLCPRHRKILEEVFGADPARVNVIVNGVPEPAHRAHGFPAHGFPADLAAQEQFDGPRLVQVGALDDRKGGVELLTAAAELARQGLRFRLWFVGEGPQREAWRRLARNEGIGHMVYFAGHRRDVDAILAGSDVVVLASHREGVPLSLLEAMALGKPVIATDVDGVPSIVSHQVTGLLVPAGDPRSLVFALKELAFDEMRRAEYGARARRVYENGLRADRMVAETFAVYGWR